MKANSSNAYRTAQLRPSRGDKPKTAPSEKTLKFAEDIAQIIFKRTEPLRLKSKRQTKDIKRLEQRIAKLETNLPTAVTQSEANK